MQNIATIFQAVLVNREKFMLRTQTEKMTDERNDKRKDGWKDRQGGITKALSGKHRVKISKHLYPKMENNPCCQAHKKRVWC